MPALRWRLNYRNILLTEQPGGGGGVAGGSVAVRLKDGRYRYMTWLGFIEADLAKGMAGARPVKLRVEEFTTGDGLTGPWEPVPEGMHIQGCVSPSRPYAVYGVLHSGRPRLV